MLQLLPLAPSVFDQGSQSIQQLSHNKGLCCQQQQLQPLLLAAAALAQASAAQRRYGAERHQQSAVSAM
jgi:hypothetical protein